MTDETDKTKKTSQRSLRLQGLYRGKIAMIGMRAANGSNLPVTVPDGID